MSDELWFVIEEESEKLFSTISYADVIYDEKTVKVNDEVIFFWNKKQCIGIIRYMDGEYYNNNNKSDLFSVTYTILSLMKEIMKKKVL